MRVSFKGVAFLAFAVLASMQTIGAMAPLLVLHPLAPKTVLRVFQAVSAAYFCTGALLLEAFGVAFVVTADCTPKDLGDDCGSVLIVANHYCRLDWLFSWSAELRCGGGGRAGARHA